MDIDGVIGSNFLRYFKVTIDYKNEKLYLSNDTKQIPAKEIILVPYGTSDFPTNIFSFGTIVRKTKDGKTVVAGFWDGSSADKLGIDIGDELVMINGEKINDLSPAETQEFYYNDNVKEIEVVYRNRSGLHKVKASKEMLLPPL